MNLKMGLFILDSGRTAKDMGEGDSYGRMGVSMKAIGRLIWRMGKVV